MEIVSNYLLSYILFSPVVAAIIVAILPRDQENLIRWTSFILSLIPLGLSIALWINFRPNENDIGAGIMDMPQKEAAYIRPEIKTPDVAPAAALNWQNRTTATLNVKTVGSTYAATKRRGSA